MPAPARGVEEPFCWLELPAINWRNCELFIVGFKGLVRLGEGCGVPVGGSVVVGAKVVELKEGVHVESLASALAGPI